MTAHHSPHSTSGGQNETAVVVSSSVIIVQKRQYYEYSSRTRGWVHTQQTTDISGAAVVVVHVSAPETYF